MDKITSNELTRLKDHHKEIKKWNEKVKSKIYEVESIYLEETKLGNIIRGWEIDGRPVSHRNRAQHEEKERLFSSSSYQVWLEQKNQSDMKNSSNDNDKKQMRTSLPTTNNKKKKRKSAESGDWNQAGDY